jgi:hypothetical protein
MRSVRARLCDCVSKQGSAGKCGEIEIYVNRWDIESVKCESGLSELELLIEEMKLDDNLFYVFLWKGMVCEHWVVYWCTMSS